jgi:hypothetical protein
MLYIGIDPGESWCGFAALDVTSSGVVRVEARTYSVTARKGYLQMAHDIMDLLPHARKATIVCEDFRIRRSGHQAFNAGNTLRFIGALEFGVKSVDAFEFFLIPPNDHSERETKELFGRVLFHYRQQWPKPRDAAWKHCLSAWRVLGHHLFAHERDLLLRIRHAKRSRRCDRWLPVSVRDHKEHIAPAARWIRP